MLRGREGKVLFELSLLLETLTRTRTLILSRRSVRVGEDCFNEQSSGCYKTGRTISTTIRTVSVIGNARPASMSLFVELLTIECEQGGEFTSPGEHGGEFTSPPIEIVARQNINGTETLNAFKVFIFSPSAQG